MRKVIWPIVFLFLCALFIQASSFAQTYTLTLEVFDIRDIQGELQVGLFNTEDAFLEIGAEFLVSNVKVDSATTLVIFTDVPQGNYAISLYHDIDSSGEINKNFIGVPTEPYGISNDAWRLLAAPRWKDASFIVESDTILIINLRH